MSVSTVPPRPVAAAPLGYDELFRRDSPYIARLVRKYLGPQASPQDIEDVSQYIAEKVFSRDVLAMYDATHASHARWLTFLTRQVELYCRGQRQGIGLRAWREPAKCDAPAGSGDTTWVELYGGAAWDEYPSLSDSELVTRLRAYLETVPAAWKGPVSLVELFDLMVERVSAGESLTAPVAAQELGLSPAAAKTGLSALRKALRAAVTPPVYDVGGVKNVTREEVTAAIEALEAKKSTAVRQVLARAGSRLADMDYHSLAALEIKAFPELNVPAGTRHAHHGKVKGAILHHLHHVLQEMSGVFEVPDYDATPVPLILPKAGQQVLHVVPEPAVPAAEEPTVMERLEAELWQLGASPEKLEEIMSLAREAFTP